MQETWVQSLGREDPLEREMATHSSSLAWRIPGTEEPGRLQSTGPQRIGHDGATKCAHSNACCAGTHQVLNEPCLFFVMIGWDQCSVAQSIPSSKWPALVGRLACLLSRFSHVWVFAALCTVAHQAPLSMEFSRWEYWSGLPFPTPGDLPNPGVKLLSLTLTNLPFR